MPRTAAQLAHLPHDELARLLSQAYNALEQAQLEDTLGDDLFFAVNRAINEWCPLTEPLQLAVLQEPDVLGMVFQHLSLSDAAASHVCTSWSQQWAHLLTVWRPMRVQGKWEKHTYAHVGRSGRQLGSQPSVTLANVIKAATLADGHIAAVDVTSQYPGIYLITHSTSSVMCGTAMRVMGESNELVRMFGSWASRYYEPDQAWRVEMFVHDDAIILGTEYGIFRVCISDGQIVATFADEDATIIECPMCLGGERLFLFDGFRLHVVDPVSLTLIQTHELSAEAKVHWMAEGDSCESLGQMIFHDGLLYVCLAGETYGCKDAGRIRVLSLTGELVRDIRPPDIHPMRQWRNPSRLSIVDDRILLLDGGETNRLLDEDKEEYQLDVSQAEQRACKVFELTLDGKYVDQIKFATASDVPMDQSQTRPHRHLLSSSSGDTARAFVLCQNGGGYVLGR